MATVNFNASEVAPSVGFEAIPAGKYQAVITDSEMRQNKSGTGEYLQLEFEIIKGEYKNRKLWARLNLNNPNPDAVRIARADLSAICHAVNIIQVSDSIELHNLPMTITVKCRKTPDGDIVNCGCSMMPTYGKKKGVSYYYYVCEKHHTTVGLSDCPVKKVPAGMVETVVQEQLDRVFRSPDILQMLVEKTGLSGDAICEIFKSRFWQEVTPAEFTRLAQLTLDKVTLFDDHMELEIRSGGLKSIMKEFEGK